MTLPWRLKHWNGSSWADAELRRYNGTSWVTTNGYYRDAGAWVLLTDRTPPTETYNETYNAVWSQTYQENNTQRGDANGTAFNYQGNSGSSPYGNQRSMWGIGDQIIDDLNGAVDFYSVRTWFDNTHTWYGSGGTASIGTHSQVNKPATFHSNRDHVLNLPFAYGEAKWVVWDNVVNEWAQEGSFTGFTLYFPSNSVTYYGYWANNIIHEISFEK